MNSRSTRLPTERATSREQFRHPPERTRLQSTASAEMGIACLSTPSTESAGTAHFTHTGGTAVWQETFLLLNGWAYRAGEITRMERACRQLPGYHPLAGGGCERIESGRVYVSDCGVTLMALAVLESPSVGRQLDGFGRPGSCMFPESAWNTRHNGTVLVLRE